MKSSDWAVVIPGLTGLPMPTRELDRDGGLAGPGVDAPDDALRADELPDRASRTAPAGRRDHDPRAGHGDADLEPAALVRGLGGGDVERQRGRHRKRRQRGADHGTLLNQRAESAAADEQEEARRRREGDRDLLVLARAAEARLEVGVDGLRSSCVGAAKKLPPVCAATVRSAVGFGRHLDALDEAADVRHLHDPGRGAEHGGEDGHLRLARLGDGVARA